MDVERHSTSGLLLKPRPLAFRPAGVAECNQHPLSRGQQRQFETLEPERGSHYVLVDEEVHNWFEDFSKSNCLPCHVGEAAGSVSTLLLRRLDSVPTKTDNKLSSPRRGPVVRRRSPFVAMHLESKFASSLGAQEGFRPVRWLLGMRVATAPNGARNREFDNHFLPLGANIRLDICAIPLALRTTLLFMFSGSRERLVASDVNSSASWTS